MRVVSVRHPRAVGRRGIPGQCADVQSDTVPPRRAPYRTPGPRFREVYGRASSGRRSRLASLHCRCWAAGTPRCRLPARGRQPRPHFPEISLTQ